MDTEHAFAIELVYALPEEQNVIRLTVAAGTTIAQAMDLSRICERYPEFASASTPLGIFGCSVAADTVLQDGDRVEIYRRLLADPKQARRRRAARNS